MLTAASSGLTMASGTADNEWISLFDGETLAGWKAGGNA